MALDFAPPAVVPDRFNVLRPTRVNYLYRLRTADFDARRRLVLF